MGAEQYRKIRNTGKILLGNVAGLEEFAPIDTFSPTDLWIVDKAQKLFKEVDDSFRAYDYSRGLNKLNHFLVAELSNVYIDICKDKMYCDGKDSTTRLASATAMAMIAKAFITTLAPVLTYTMDELIEYAPEIITGGVKNIFEMEKYYIPKVESKLNEEHLLEAKSKFAEIKDKLNKDKTIKSTLELIIYTNSEELLALDSTIAEDWFVVSNIVNEKQTDAIDSFEVDGKEFIVYKATDAKCPRCWKFKSSDEESLCGRCESVVNS